MVKAIKTHPSKDKTIGYWSVVSIGIGGMVGGGIFAVLGLSVQLARGGAPIAFALAGVVALLTAYSYARLSVAFPTQGGTVKILLRLEGKLVAATFVSNRDRKEANLNEALPIVIG